ncbi:hypothetical protein GGF44_000759 [Coemansia sp. RSA 1694]|nr:hypothetical protein GGF44_000759 [Coemansia sp. RSA 1694]
MAVASASALSADPRIVLITGCSAGGIGHHLALEFAAQGCRVFAGVRTLSKAQALAENTPRIEVIELNITDAGSVDAAVAHILAATNGWGIDVLVNNAGVFCVGPAAEVPASQVQQAFDTNVIGLARMCRAVAPAMIDRRQGTIVNVGSVSGYVATPWVGCYAATKAAVHAYSDALRMELRPFGVRVVVVAPGSITSNLVANHSADLLLLLDDDAAAETRYLAARPAVEARAALSQASDSTPADLFARTVVPQILCSSTTSPPAYITCGTHSAAMWLLYYVPPVIRDYLLGRRFGTHQLERDVGKKSAAASKACPVSGRRSTGSSGGACPMSSSSLSRSAPSCPIASPAALWVALAAAAVAVGATYVMGGGDR